MAAKRILDLWKQLEACEAHVEHLKQSQTRSDNDASSERLGRIRHAGSRFFVCSQNPDELI
jgi:hypothetical protein